METTFFRLDEPDNSNIHSFHQKTNYVLLFSRDNIKQICFNVKFYYNLKKTKQINKLLIRTLHQYYLKI